MALVITTKMKVKNVSRSAKIRVNDQACVWMYWNIHCRVLQMSMVRVEKIRIRGGKTGDEVETQWTTIERPKKNLEEVTKSRKMAGRTKQRLEHWEC